MKRKQYMKPTIQIVRLQHQCSLLQASLPGYDSESWSPEADFDFDEELQTFFNE